MDIGKEEEEVIELPIPVHPDDVPAEPMPEEVQVEPEPEKVTT